MAQVIGTVQTITGEASIITDSGESVQVTPNMKVGADSIVKTQPGANMVIAFADGTTMNIGPEEFVLIDKTVHDSEEIPQDETQAEVDALQAILAEDPNLSVFEETASGEAVAVGGSSIIVDSIETHNSNYGDSGSTALEQFASNQVVPEKEEEDRFNLVIDDTPVIITLTDLLTNDNTPTITGTVNDPNAVIIITAGENSYTATNNGDGSWILSGTDPLPDGETTITVVATDPEGHETTKTATITVDTNTPTVTVDDTSTSEPKTTLTGELDYDNAIVTIGGSVDDDTATIVVTINGEDHTATNNGDGTWTLPVTGTLEDGPVTVVVTATDPAGNITTETATVNIDATAPAITVDTTPTNDTTPLISGTTDDPDATITVTIGSNNYTATNNGDGTWSVPVTETLTEGETKITVTSSDPSGNTSTIDATVTVDTTAPSVTVDDLESSDTTPAISGTTDDSSATIVVTVGGNDYTATNNGDGTWTLADDTITTLPEGENIITVTATDAAGNNTTVSTSTGSITIDTTPPVLTLDTTPVNDTTPILTGTVSENDAAIVVSINGTDYTATNNGDGTWSLPLTDDLAEGDTSVTIVATDPSGNATTITETITVDTTTPTVTVDTTPTNDATQVHGTITENDATITVTVGGIEHTATNNGDGTWTLPVTLSEGESTITVTATDPAGNTSSLTETLYVDTIAPVIAIDAIHTNNPQPEITGTIDDTTATITVTVTDGNESVSYTAINGGDGTWVLPAGTVDTLPFETDFDLIVTATDSVGNITTVQDVLRVDNTLTDEDNDNGGNVVTIDSITDDNGAYSDDFITNDATLIIRGTFDNESDTSLIVKVDGVDVPVVITDKNWVVDLQAQPFDDGTHTIEAVVTDMSGNSVTTTQNISIDTSNSSDDGTGTGIGGADATVTLDEVSDNYINLDESQQGITVTGTTTLVSGNEITVELNGKTYTTTASGGNLSSTPNTFSVTIPTQDLQLMADGTYTVTATVVADLAGNTISDTEDVTVDTSTTGDATVTLDAISDDFINNEETTQDLSITGSTTGAVQGTEVTIFVNGQAFTTTTTDSSGNYMATIPANTFSVLNADGSLRFIDGSYTVVAEIAADAAGNTVRSTEHTVILDRSNSDNNGNGTADDGSDAIVTLNQISDNFINKDETINETIPITGTTSDSDALVKIYVNGQYFGDTTAIAGAFSLDIPQGTFTQVDGDGNLLFPDGTYEVTATVVADLAGNTYSDTQSVVLDTTFTDDNNDYDNGNGDDSLIAITGITNDSGIAGDYITNDNTLVISGTFDNEDVNRILEVTVDGIAYNVTTSSDTSDKTWSVDLQNTVLTDGDHEIIAVIEDDAGNTQSVSQTVTIDTAPTDPDAIVLDEISNNYINAAEYDQPLTIAGSVGSNSSNGDNITITLNGKTYNTTVTDGRFSVNVPVDDVHLLSDNTPYVAMASTTIGANTLTDTENFTVDLALTNTGNNNGNLITIDGITEDTGVSNSDFITNDTTLIISGTYDNSSDINGIANHLSITINGQLYTPVLTGTNWSIDLTNTPLSDGDYNLEATLSDAAGNTFTQTQTITIDTTVNIVDGDASIVLNEISNNVINAAEASDTNLTTISGSTTAADGQTVSILVNGNPFTTTLVSGGTFSVDIPKDTFAAYPDGTYEVTASVMADAAGNIVSDAQSVILDTSFGEMLSDTNSVKESSLEFGTNPSESGRTTQGNLFDNDTLDSDAGITNVSFNGIDAVALADNANIVSVDTPSGILFVATANTTFNGINYNAGDYLYTLETSGTTLQENFTYTMSDSAGNVASSGLTINIVDDEPVGQTLDKYLVEKVEGFSTNLVLMLDTSGSMDDLVDGVTRLQLMKDAVNNMIDAYAVKGDVNIKLIQFDDGAQYSQWFNSNEIDLAKADINALSAGGQTDYDAATYTLINNYNNPNTAPVATDTQVYFLSDGAPTGSDGGFFGIGANDNSLNSSEQTDWANFLNNVSADVHAIGIGTGTDTAELKTISSPNNPSGPNDPVIVTDENQLQNALLQTLTDGSISGNIATEITNTAPIIFGADGGTIDKLELVAQDGSIFKEITYDSVNDTYTTTAFDTLGNTLSTVTEAANASGVTTTTDLSATVSIDFNTGEYSYNIDVDNTNIGKEEDVKIYATDGDGDTAVGNFTLHIDNRDAGGDDILQYDASAQRNDGGIGTDILVLSSGEDLDFSNISNIQNMEIINLVGGDHDVLNLEVADIINMTDADNVLTIYGDSGDSVSKPVGTAETWTEVQTGVDDGNGHTVNVYNVSDGAHTVVVNIEQEIIVS